MQIEITLTENDLKKLVQTEIESRLNGTGIDPSEVKIEVKSKENFKAEWETAQFRARVNVHR